MSSETAHSHNRLFFTVWVWLLVITGVEVALAYVHFFPPPGMLAVLMVLSLVKAALIVSYFMHLRFEQRSLVLSLVPAVVLVIALLFIFFPDSFRLYELGIR